MPALDDTDTADFNVDFIEPLDDMPDDEIHDIDGMLDSDDEDTLEVYAAYREYQLLGLMQGHRYSYPSRLFRSPRLVRISR